MLCQMLKLQNAWMSNLSKKHEFKPYEDNVVNNAHARVIT